MNQKVELFIMARTSFFRYPTKENLRFQRCKKSYDKKKLLRVGQKIEGIQIDSNIFLSQKASQKNGLEMVCKKIWKRAQIFDFFHSFDH